MCTNIQKIGSVYVESVIYGCNSMLVKIQNVTHNLDTLVSYGTESVVLSNNISIFELYTPAIDINKVLECFRCKETVKFDNIDELKGLGSIINSFNTNSNNSNSNNTQDSVGSEKAPINIQEQLNRIEHEIQVRNYGELSFYPFVIIICLVLAGVIVFIAKNL